MAEALLLISDSEIYIGDIIVLKQIIDDDNIMGKPKFIQSTTKLAMDCVSYMVDFDAYTKESKGRSSLLLF